jgi:CheY-like chemotaxis protein
MGNAIKFTEAGEVELSIDVEEEKDSRIKLHTIIRDTGIGIPNENLDTIFEAFKQADDSHTRKYGGTGLGLAICKQIARLMDGDVWAERPSGHGTENQPPEIQDTHSQIGGPGSMFHFTAWFGKAEGKEAKRFAPVSLVGKEVLIADDNQTNLDILTHIFQLVGMRVVALKNGGDVIPTLQEAQESENPFSLFISDIQMPDIGGYEVAKKIRDSKYQFSNIPLIALSSSVERDAQKCEEAGFDGFLSKPVQREKLFQILDRIMGEKKEEGEKHEMVREEIVTQYSVREDMKHSMRILLAEDNPVNQKLANIMLTKAGYKVEVANNGREAFEKYTASPGDFDLILMDIQMPEMDGLEATKAIREKGFDTIPIIAMTAHALKGDKEKCLDVGMNDYIPKPIKRELVFEILEKWILKKEKL